MPLIASRPAVRWRRWRPVVRTFARPVAAPVVATGQATAPAATVATHARPPATPAPPAALRRGPGEFSSRVFPRPFALRALFAGVEPPDPVPDVVALLSAPTLAEAEVVGRRLGLRQWTPRQDEALRALVGLCFGGQPPSEPWDERAEADALRLRVLREAADGGGPDVGWISFLRWAGRRLESAPLARLPRHLAAAVVASLAATRGYRGAFELLTQRGPLDGAFAEPLALAALRCTLAGDFLPQCVAFLLPRPRRRSATGRDPWAAALFALRACRERSTVAGLVHLTAALVAADVRERVVTLAPGAAAPALRRRWWDPPQPAHENGLMLAVNLVRAGVPLARPAHGPWGRDRGGPDTAAVVDAVKRLLPWDSGSLALEVFLDDRLAVAALFAAGGYAPSAAAQLAEAAVPKVLERARRALADALARPLASADAAVFKERPWSAAAERVYQSVAGTGDLSVELATPHWMLGSSRGVLVSRLVAAGRADLARTIRLVLDRPDLRRDLEPFWILRGGEAETAAVAELARWLAARGRTVPAEADWLRFAEDVCRRLLREEPAGQGRTP